MIKPVFKYTNKIVNKLVEIISAREVILYSYLIPKWEGGIEKRSFDKNNLCINSNWGKFFNS